MTIPRPPHTPSHSIVPLRQRPAWNALKEHSAKVRSLQLRQLFAEDSQRGERFTLEVMGLYFDYSKNQITSETDLSQTRKQRGEARTKTGDTDDQAAIPRIRWTNWT